MRELKKGESAIEGLLRRGDTVERFEAARLAVG
jgi:hypothetical protein